MYINLEECEKCPFYIAVLTGEAVICTFEGPKTYRIINLKDPEDVQDRYIPCPKKKTYA